MDNLLLMMAPLFSSKLLLVLFFGTLFGLILVGPKPGRTPNIKPNKVPKNKTNNSFELNKGAIINNKLSI